MERDGAYIYLACLLRFAVATVVAPVEMIFNANFSTCIPAVLSVYLYSSGYFLARLKGRAKKRISGKIGLHEKGKNGVQTKEIFLPRTTFLFDTDQDDRFGPYHFRLGNRVRECRVAAGYFFNRDVRPKVFFGDKVMTGLSGFVTIVPSPILFNGNQ